MPSPPFMRRVLPSVLALLVYGAFAFAWQAAPSLHSSLGSAVNLLPGRPLFSDLRDILAAGACWREGVDVYAPSACLNGGIFNYSPLLLHFLILPPAARSAGGMVIDVLLLSSFSLLPPSRSAAEILLRFCAICSSAVTLALASANIDGVILMAAALALVLLGHRAIWPLGYATFMGLAGIKFYPAALLAVALGEDRRRVVLIGCAVALAGLAYIVLFAHGAGEALRSVPRWLPFLAVFGANDMMFGIEMFLHGYSFVTGALPQPGGIGSGGAAMILLATRLLMVAAIGGAIALAPHYVRSLAALAPGPNRFLIGGAAIIAFCFFAAQNVDYRAMFLLFTLPGVQAMAAGATGPHRRRLRLLLVLILCLLWEQTLLHVIKVVADMLPAPVSAKNAILFMAWLARELAWWWVVVEFGAILAAFFQGSLARLMAWKPVAA